MTGSAPPKAHLVLLLIAAAGCSSRPPGTIRPIDPPAGPGAFAPRLSSLGARIGLTWLEPAEAGHILRSSFLREEGWEAPREILQGGRIFANWADLPGMEPLPAGGMVAHWLEMSGPGPYDYAVNLSRLAPAQSRWKPMGQVHDDRSAAEHGFVSWAEDGARLRAFWLDGRAMAGPPQAGMMLRTALVGEEVGGEQLLDDRVCECCQTDAAATREGPVVVYRDRSMSEVRDIGIVRRDKERWSRPALVHPDGWVVPGCPVNGPAIDSDGDLRVAVAWFTAAGNRPRVLAAFSGDAGATFGSPVLVDGRDPEGRVDVALDPAGGAIVSWLAGEGSDEATLRLRRVRQDGRAGEPVLLGASSRRRASGFPRIRRQGRDLIVVWTQDTAPSRVRGALVPLEILPEPGRNSAEPAAPPPASSLPGRDEALDFAARGLDGETVSLSELRGDAILLNVWATWCSPCRQEIPVLAALHARHAASGLRVVGVSVDEQEAVELVRRFVASERIPYTILLDPEGRVRHSFDLSILPSTLLLDRRGRLVWSRHGMLEAGDEELDRVLTETLGSVRP